jgi:DNA-binding NarL/FixJ family response regulator
MKRLPVQAVRTRARNALRKLGAQSRSEVARAARERGLV